MRSFEPIESKILSASGAAEWDENIIAEQNTLNRCFENICRPEFSFFDDQDAPIGAKTISAPRQDSNSRIRNPDDSRIEIEGQLRSGTFRRVPTNV
jgi:hypothetical protein